MIKDQELKELFLKYALLLADLNFYAPEDGFEFALWRYMKQDHCTYGDELDYQNIRKMSQLLNGWFVYNCEKKRMEIIPLDQWEEIFARQEKNKML
jgi:hypothetical protein